MARKRLGASDLLHVRPFAGSDAGFRWVKLCPASKRQFESAPAKPCCRRSPPLQLRGTAHLADFAAGAARCEPLGAKGGRRRFGLEVVPVAACLCLVEWLRENGSFRSIPQRPGYMAGPLAPVRYRYLSLPVQKLPESVRGDNCELGPTLAGR